MSLSKKDIELITQLIQGNKNADVQQEKQPSKEKKTSKKELKSHKRSEIPTILQNMSKQDSIDTFGNFLLNPKEIPYMCSLDKFFKEYNIELETRTRNGKEYTDKPSLSRALRHQLIIKQLKGENKKTFDTVKTNCMKFLQEKINAIPETTTDVRLQKRREYNVAELKRWEDEQYTK